MPGKIKVKVLAGRNLPVMDRASDTTDAFVEIKFGGVTHKTDVCRKSLNPHWNSTEWYRFEVDESELQDEPLQLRLMDHDTYSANDAIGKVVISLAPLLAREANNVKGATGPHGGAVMSGWIPVFDTMHGIRGELNVIVKVELFSDFNKYKTSSCGVQFFHCPMIPPGYRTTAIHGFVEELVVNDDPEYQWIDKIRTPRASNEARQVAFIKLSNQVQRLVGLKAAELGANAVVGYQQDFDLEGEAGVVARAVGTAVSITPLPTPSQQANVPQCTQQQLKKYLDILVTDDESTTDLSHYYETHQDELQRLITILNPKTPSLLDETDAIEEEEKSYDLTRQSSIKSYAGNVSIYQEDYISQKSLKHISEDQTDLNRLLNRNDDDDSDSSGPFGKIKKIKTHFFKKKVAGNSREKQDDTVSLKSTSSDTSRLSIVDIKNEFKKLKRLKKPKFRKVVNMEDEGVGMASILARSVIHAHTSLACINETQDSEHSPTSTLRRTSESEPNINAPDVSKINTAPVIVAEIIKENKEHEAPRIKFTSMKNVSIDNEDDTLPVRERKISESCPTTPVAARTDNLLKLPGEQGYFDSVSSALSGDSSEIYSSSDDDDESSDVRTDTEKSIETTSSVVQSVLSHEVNPALIAQMERKLSMLETRPPDINVVQTDQESTVHLKCDELPTQTESNKELTEKSDANNLNRRKSSSATKPINTSVSNHRKLNNPFAHKKTSKSISAPSSPSEKNDFVHRSSRRIKRQLSKISKSNMIKSLSHYSLLPKRKEKPLSQPGSSSDMHSIMHGETVLGAPFLSYTDLLSLDKESMSVNKLHKSDEFGHAKVSMYIGSEPVSRASLSGPSLHDYSHEHHGHKKDKPTIKPTGLVHTAMETILMDKVQSLLLPTSPDHTSTSTKQFFNDVNVKLEKVEEAQNKNEAVTKTPPEQISRHIDKKRHSQISGTSDETSGFVHTAMETILPDKVQSLLPETSKNVVIESPITDTHTNEKPVKHKKPLDIIHIAKDKVHSLITPKTPEMLHKIFFGDKSTTEKSESSGLIHTAMETILIDKVQSLIDPEAIQLESIDNTAEKKDQTIHKSQEPSSLVQTAMETMLIDKVQNLIGEAVDTQDFSNENIDVKLHPVDRNYEKMQETEPKSSSLVKSAIETILIDKVQTLIGAETPIHEGLKDHEEQKDSERNVKKDDDSDSLISTAMQTILMDKVQSILTPVSDKTTSLGDSNSENSKNQRDKKDKKLVRQDSVHSASEVEDSSHKMSKTPPKHKITPVLQHFHPILSGAPNLETIPSLPESSFDHTESLDVEGVCEENSNNTSVCGNSHAVCDVDRREERDKDKDKEKGDKDKGSPRHARHESYGGREPVVTPHVPNASLNSSSTPLGIHRRSSDSDLSVTPKGSSLTTSAGNVGSGGGAILRPSMNSNNLEMLEYPFLTMTEYPPGFIVHIGGTVCARSVKLVDGGGESAARAAWWAELRTELRAHARALRCNAVLAYVDTAAICEDVCVLSASGTAAVINLDCDFNVDPETLVSLTSGSKNAIDELDSESCSVAHVPYSPGAGPYRAELSTCGGCRRARVPAVLLATCAKPTRLTSYAKAVTLTAVAARVRRAPPTAEPGARDISDQLPFLEYELHKLLLAKLRMQGANALFSLQTQICIGERCVMALASGTAVRLAALPPPNPPRIKASENDKDAIEIQKALWDAFTANKAANGYDIGGPESNHGPLPETEGEEPPALDLCSDKDACVLELDEAEDVETARSLASRRVHMQVYNSVMKPLVGAPPHAFAQVWRARFALSAQGGTASAAAERHVARALDGVAYKLRRLRPCALGTPRFQLELPEDEIQLIVSGAAVPLRDPSKPDLNGVTENGHDVTSQSNRGNGTGDADDDIFVLDEEQLTKSNQPEVIDEKSAITGQVPTTVSLTSLSVISGSRVVRRVCALRLLFVRETTAVRELGGLSGFLHTFTCEVLAIVRSYTAALGGNALTSFYIRQLMLQDNAHKNQGQCLLSVGGDVVHIMY